MKLGIDLSMLDQLEQSNAVYRYQGEKIDPFVFFANHSRISLMRLRLWNDPFDEEGHPYGGGTNDIECFLRLARRAQAEGMKILLDFHYSDFWCDPGRQQPPKAWAGLPFKEVVKKLEEFTRDTLRRIQSEGIDIYAVQIGNEETNGIVSPYGNIHLEFNEHDGGGFKGFAALFKAGCKAVKEIYPNALTLCHITHPGDFGMQDWYFSNLLAEGAEFDVIGESYYPYWHGTFADFESSMKSLMEKYHKPVWIVEMGYEWAHSMIENHHFELTDDSDMFKEGNINGRVPFPLTKEGQSGYLKKFIEICHGLGVDAIFYWEPAWILLEHSGWADDAGQVYCGLTPTKADNDWANETLFDYEGNANPAVEIFTQDYVDSLD